MSRKLASIKIIRDLVPIPNKDKIELAFIDGWQVIVKKDEFIIGDKVIYIEIDSQLPEVNEFEFLRKNKFRIKTIKMGGVLSQGICFPMSILKKKENKYKIGQDVTKELSIIKYDKYIEKEPIIKYKNPILRYLMRFSFIRRLLKEDKDFSQFPPFIFKTDETRVQNIPHILKENYLYEVTEKIDGQSGTFYLKKVKSKIPFVADTYHFGVCSKNFELKYKPTNTYWQIAKKYNLEVVLSKMLGDNDWIAIQGECIGPSIQGNKYNVSELDLYIFNIISSSKGRYSPYYSENDSILSSIKKVPLITFDKTQSYTISAFLDLANGKSKLNKDILREGLVFRNYENKISFKAISPDFLLKYD